MCGGRSGVGWGRLTELTGWHAGVQRRGSRVPMGRSATRLTRLDESYRAQAPFGESEPMVSAMNALVAWSVARMEALSTP